MVEYWCLPYSRLPAVLSGASIMCFVLGTLLGLANASPIQVLPLILLGLTLGLLSAGREVRVAEGSVILQYGFPKAVIKYVVRDVVSVLDVNELESGNLVRYFKYHLFVFSLIIALPLIYLLVKGLYPSPAYLPLIFLPVFLGVILQLYIVMTSKSYRRMIRLMTWVMAGAWSAIGFVVGMTYREIYGKSLFSDPNASVLYFTGMLLLAAMSVLLLALMGGHHVVIIEANDGKFYAIGTLNAEAARELIKTILKEVVGGAEATA